MIIPDEIAAAFTLGEVRIVPTGRDEHGHLAFAKAPLLIGGVVELVVTIRANGDVIVPREIKDKPLEAAIRHAMRVATLEAVIATFNAATNREARLAQAYAENVQRFLVESGSKPAPGSSVPSGKTVH